MNIIITIVGHGYVARIAVHPAADSAAFREGAHAALATIRRRGMVSYKMETSIMLVETEWESGFVAVETASIRSAKA